MFFHSSILLFICFLHIQAFSVLLLCISFHFLFFSSWYIVLYIFFLHSYILLFYCFLFFFSSPISRSFAVLLFHFSVLLSFLSSALFSHTTVLFYLFIFKNFPLCHFLGGSSFVLSPPLFVFYFLFCYFVLLFSLSSILLFFHSLNLPLFCCTSVLSSFGSFILSFYCVIIFQFLFVYSIVSRSSALRFICVPPYFLLFFSFIAHYSVILLFYHFVLLFFQSFFLSFLSSLIHQFFCSFILSFFCVLAPLIQER